MTEKISAPNKNGFHAENLHREPYAFEALVASNPPLRKHLRQKENNRGVLVDFSDPEAVLCLNQSLLKHYYGIEGWTLPPNYLCPGVPGRVDYLHHLNDLIKLPRTNSGVPKMLDIGTGANGIYALLAAAHFKWKVIATDCNASSLENLNHILEQNLELRNQIELRHQEDPQQILHGVLNKQDKITVTACNPPFYPSTEVANQAHLEKHHTHLKRKIGSHEHQRTMSGIDQELVYPGGEVAFVTKLIRESVDFKSNIHWFTSLLSKETSLGQLQPELDMAKPQQQRVIPMQHGNKVTRILCWSFEPTI